MEKTKELSFNKRIFLTKKEVFEGCTGTKELDNIKGTNKIGFYSLSTIGKYLFPSLAKYSLDIDLNINEKEIIGIWYDGLDDNKSRNVTVDFSRIKNIGRLQLMANEVQSEGAVKSYTRRYALTSILNLPSTDTIDPNPPQKKDQKDQQEGQKKKPQNIIGDNQRKFMFAKMKEAGVTEAKAREYIRKAFNIESFTQLTNPMFNTLIASLEKEKQQKINNKELFGSQNEIPNFLSEIR